MMDRLTVTGLISKTSRIRFVVLVVHLERCESGDFMVGIVEGFGPWLSNSHVLTMRVGYMRRE